MEGEGKEKGSEPNQRRTYPWIRTAARDPNRQADNEATLTALEGKYGPQLVARAAETVAIRKGCKLYPDDADMLAELRRLDGDDGWPKPTISVQEAAALGRAEKERVERMRAERLAKMNGQAAQPAPEEPPI